MAGGDRWSESKRMSDSGRKVEKVEKVEKDERNGRMLSARNRRNRASRFGGVCLHSPRPDSA